MHDRPLPHEREVVDEPARALLFVDGVKRVETRFPRTEDTFRWYGRVDGKPVAIPSPRAARVSRSRARA